MSNQISYISVDKIFPHPKNPRGQLGDLTELASSIEANGVLQNLTVVPYVNVGNPIEGFYTVIIGHRRLAAAEKAGLDVVPCVIAEMDEKEQVATMMLENLQRSDLTIYEQAKGFQMMFDLGESTKSISEKTGLSESTIKSRTSLLKLDEKKFKDATERGATLQDLCELNTIGDEALRNKVLDTVGTANFRSELNGARDKEIRDKNKPRIIEQLERFAEKTKDSSGKAYVDSYSMMNQAETIIKIPDDAGHVKYYWYECGSYIYLYKDKIKTLEEIRQDQKTEQDRHARDMLDDLTRKALKLRYDFMDNYPGRKRDIPVLNEAMAMLFGESEGVIYYDKSNLDRLISINGDEDVGEQVREYYELFPEQALACMIYSALECDSARYYSNDLVYRGHSGLERVYDFLIKLGYQISDEELSLKNGTHILMRNA